MDTIASILERLRPYVSGDDVEIADVATLARMIADRAADDQPKGDDTTCPVQGGHRYDERGVCIWCDAESA